MTELEWLKHESDLSDDELKQYEAVLGNAKFKVMLTKLQAAKDNATSKLTEAEQQRLNLEAQYTNVIQPELRKITTEALAAKGENAKLKAELQAAREYGIVPPGAEEPPAPRAPGSPDPTTSDYISRDEIKRLQAEAGTGLAAMNDLNAEHFKLFNSPVPNMQELITEVNRQRTLGHQADIRSVWEQKHNVTAKRAEIAAADQKKHDDEIVARTRKEMSEQNGDNPNLRTGRPSRFSSYEPSKDSEATKPWQRSNLRSSNNQGWRSESASKLESVLNR